MKRIVAFLLAAMLVFTCAFASADTTLNGKKNRKIKIKTAGLNEMIEGVSPTTGRTLADIEVPEGFAGLAVTGRYMPMLVQISNANGGVEKVAPWGLLYADILYETPLNKKGDTRISALFSDVLPDAVGPVRSARVGHCWIREEWDAAFVFYGGQEAEGSNIRDVFRKYGANKKNILFDGIVGEGKPWKKFYERVKGPGLGSPNNVTANIAAMYDLIPEDHVAPNHTFLFTDEVPEGKPATDITVKWGKEGYDSHLIYNEEEGVYYRYMVFNKGKEVLYADRYLELPIAFDNVIVQFATTNYNRSSAAPVTNVVGKGNADYFMAGVHVQGYWVRKEMEDRTVFYGPDGKEISLQRGRTLIIILPPDKKVTYK